MLERLRELILRREDLEALAPTGTAAACGPSGGS